jgi:hypothetical protein
MAYLQAQAVTTDLHVSPFIVSAGGATNGANYTTIGSAITAAVAAGGNHTIFIQPGAYTENLTLAAGINLTAYPCDATTFLNSSATTNVTIIGKCSASFNGSASFSGINFQTNSDYAVEVTGSSTTNLFFSGCNFNGLNNSIFHYASSNSGRFYIYDCTGNLDTTGIAYFVATSGDLRIYGGVFGNDGGSTTASTISAGTIGLHNTEFHNSITTSSTAGITAINNSQMIGTLTVGGSGTNNINLSSFSSASSSAISVGTGSTLTVADCVIDSSNTNAITGLGTLAYSGLSFINTSSLINATTQTANIARPGITRSSQQPAFMAYVSATTGGLFGNSSSNVTVPFNAVRFDQASNFNTSTNTFTAPYAGKYLFTIDLRLGSLSATMTYADCRLITTQDTLVFSPINAGAAQTINTTPNQIGLGGSVLVTMNAGDTATVAVVVSGGASAAGTFIGGASAVGATNFSGYLVC